MKRGKIARRKAKVLGSAVGTCRGPACGLGENPCCRSPRNEREDWSYGDVVGSLGVAARILGWLSNDRRQ